MGPAGHKSLQCYTSHYQAAFPFGDASMSANISRQVKGDVSGVIHVSKDVYSSTLDGKKLTVASTKHHEALTSAEWLTMVK